jgi:hypothetical protein
VRCRRDPPLSECDATPEEIRVRPHPSRPRLALALAALLACAVSGSAQARLVFTTADAAFTGSVRVPLDASSGFAPTGAGGSESFQLPFGARDTFVGAAEIGAIASATLNDGCYAAAWSALHFVPGDAPPPPIERVDLSTRKRATPAFADQSDPGIAWSIDVANAGPDTARGTRTIDFLPGDSPVVASDPPASEVQPGLVEQTLGDLTNGAADAAFVETAVPPFESFGCESILVNVASATSSSIETDPSDNPSLGVAYFDASSRRGTGEICGNGRDDDCNGRADCGDPACDCRPSLPAGPNQCFGGLELVPLPEGGEILLTDLCDGSRPEDNPAPNHGCTVPRGVCGGATVPAFCCDPAPGRTRARRTSRASRSATSASPAARRATRTTRSRSRRPTRSATPTPSRASGSPTRSTTRTSATPTRTTCS